jgi:hypothetical protein
MNDADRQALETLDARLRILLPAQYQETYEDVQTTSMGAAGLKYDTEGRVAWDEIWDNFCDLAMAGGPPHKGTLLDPGMAADVESQFERYDEVAEEICRGISMVTGLRAYVALAPGWVSVSCPGEAMAQWLVRAITMENVAVRRRGSVLDLPAAPHFRLEKEIKNVVTVMAKTSHYWLGHIPRDQQEAIGTLFAQMSRKAPLVAPGYAGADGQPCVAALAVSIVRRLNGATTLAVSDRHNAGWLGIQSPSVRAAVWMMRALVASNVLSRRESSTLFVPLDPAVDPAGEVVSSAVGHVHHLAVVRGIA